MKQIFIEFTGEMEYMVKAIKGVRAISGLGLKESKELVQDLVLNGGTQLIDITGNNSSYQSGLHMIREAGGRITEVTPGSPARKNLAEQIRGAVTYASLSGQYDISHALIEFLQNYFPEGTQDKEE